ncbi:MAG: bifunctional enoyl-CoA hydratase/phosphate acetyltransferase [Treponema sp.]|jgi:phosphate butyryltransferase|nr:bifunctional enoyl-CoA hydratase/phosphate acetyltransferase [Treponema sp.]
MKTIQDLVFKAGDLLVSQNKENPRLVIASADDDAVLEAVSKAKNMGLQKIILIGDQDKMKKIARRQNIDLHQFEVIHEKNNASAAEQAVLLIKDDHADMIMKGLVESSVFLKAVLKKDMGINLGKKISHVSVVESPNYHKLMFLTDGAIIIAPTLNDKEAIIKNAVELACSTGLKMPKVALLAAIEMVNPEKMPCTVDAAILTQRNRRGEFANCIIDGPLAFDNAVNENSVKVKKIDSSVAGDADIFVVPSIETGNILYKSLVYMGNAKSAGLVMGTRVPVILTSRADSPETKLASIALGILSWYREDC